MAQDTIEAGNSLTLWCVIPVYNCSTVAAGIARTCCNYCEHVLVVDDGSTDADLSDLLAGSGIVVLRHATNMGKGAALLTALQYIGEQGGTHMIVLDGDGQHFPEDIPKLTAGIEEHPAAIVIGCRDFNTPNVPRSSRFGRSFSNMWVAMESGASLEDTQSGFRAYPVEYITALKLKSRFYDFEIEVLVRSIWAGLEVIDVPISVHYPRAEERISCFRPFVDNLRLSLLHARLVGRRLIPLPHLRLIQKADRPAGFKMPRTPRQFLKMLMRENATPSGLAAAAAVGTFLGIVPVIGFHTALILYASARLHLNKVMSLSIQNLYAPPFVPFLCIELGYYMRHGTWLGEFSRETVLFNMHHRIFEWLLGSLVLAPSFAFLAAVITFGIACSIEKGNGAASRKGECVDGERTQD